jgi:hypothetical protein
VISGHGISSDYLSSGHESMVPVFGPLSQPSAPMETPQHQEQSLGTLNEVFTDTEILGTSVPANQPRQRVTNPPLDSFGTLVITQPTVSRTNLPSTRLPFINTTVS